MATRRNKTTLTTQSPPVAMAQEGPPGTAPAQGSSPAADANRKATFGIVVDVNGKQITVPASDISNFASKGIEFDLPEPVEVGNYADLSSFLKDKLGVSLPDLKELPSPFTGVGDKIAETKVSVKKFHIKVPSKTAQRPNQYTLSMSAEWPGETSPLQVGPITIKGFTFGVTNEPPK